MKRTLSAVARRIAECGLMPIVRFDTLDQALGIVAALREAKVDIVEFPMTSAHALKAIEKTADACGDSMIVGAGTVLDVKTAKACMSAGARFIVSPCVSDGVIAACRRGNTAVCPGALTPTEVYHAWDTGADFVKIFPCNSLGGVSYIKSLRTPLPDIALIPVGGVTVDNAGDFIRAGCAALGVGNGIVDKQAVAAARFIDVTQAALKYMKALHDARTPI